MYIQPSSVMHHCLTAQSVLLVATDMSQLCSLLCPNGLFFCYCSRHALQGVLKALQSLHQWPSHLTLIQHAKGFLSLHESTVGCGHTMPSIHRP